MMSFRLLVSVDTLTGFILIFFFFFFFRTVSRVSLSGERWFKDRGNGSCSFCLDVLWLCVAAVETSEQEAPVKHSNYQHVHVQVLWSKAFHFFIFMINRSKSLSQNAKHQEPQSSEAQSVTKTTVDLLLLRCSCQLQLPHSLLLLSTVTH